VCDTKRRQLGGSGLAHAGVQHGGGGGGGPVLTARGCGGGEQRSAKGKGSDTLGVWYGKDFMGRWHVRLAAMARPDEQGTFLFIQIF
jgi:hypothetical protein